ncbi:DUF3106 domain-containing protein [Tunturiibacter gelidiferens]
MPSFFQLRPSARLVFAGMILSSATMIALAQPGPAHRAGVAFRAPIGQSRPSPPVPAPAPKRNQEHLAQWMDRHSNLPLAEQQRALENEPGFRDLPPPTQQRMRDRLTQLNNMSPEQRRRILDRTEAMERLTLPQRQQVRGAMQQLGGLPEDRRRLVARAFRDLREMPQPQRQAILDSDRFRGQFSDQERSTLSNLLAVEPYLPVRRPNDGTSYGK